MKKGEEESKESELEKDELNSNKEEKIEENKESKVEENTEKKARKKLEKKPQIETEKEIKKEVKDKATDTVKQEENKEENKGKIETVVLEKEQSVEEKEVVIENKKDEEVKQEENTNKPKSRKLIVIAVILIIALIFVSTIFAIMNINNNKIVGGVHVQGVDVSNLTEDEAINKLNQKAEEISKKNIKLTYKDYWTTITPEQIELKFNFIDAVKDAQRIGKANNILVDNYSILKANIFKTNIEANVSYNKEVLLNMLKSIDSEIPNGVKEVSYEVDDDELIITRGKSGVAIDLEELEQDIIENIEKQLQGKEEEIEIPVENKQAKDIDLEQIYKEVYKEPKDAYIEEEPFKLHVEEDGLDFKISMDEAKELLKEDKETYKIPLKITKPKVKTSDLGNKIFKQTLSKYTTIYDAGNRSRSTNIAIAARTINGTIILPGETFSYNKVLGNTTKEKGYQLGTAYVGGKVVPAYGGGICQVSSTLYNAVLYANLGIVERYNHSYAVSYVPAGRDATVSYGGKDFKFKNTRQYPVKISASAKNGVVSISILGIKEEKEYQIELKSSVLSRTPCQVVYQKNSNLAEGKQRVIQAGYNGLKSKAYKVVKYNGKVISTTLLSSDTYKPMDRIIEKGTKKTQNGNKDNNSSKGENNTVEEAEVTENED